MGLFDLILCLGDLILKYFVFRELWKDTTIFLTFKNKEIESAYTNYREPFSTVPLLASVLIQIAGGLYSFLVLPRTMIHFGIILAPLFIILLIAVISIAESFPTVSFFLFLK